MKSLFIIVEILLILDAVFIQTSYAQCAHMRRMKEKSAFPSRSSTRDMVCDDDAIYRTLNGQCNNKDHKNWGALSQPYKRLLDPIYEDVNGGLRLSNYGDFNPSGKLPQERKISTAFKCSFRPPPKMKITDSFVQFGQAVTHDILHTQFSFEVLHTCCEDYMTFNEFPECEPMDLRGDEFYAQFDVECHRFARSDHTILSGIREQINEATSYIDASLVYGNTPEVASQLRTYLNGKMKVDDEYEIGTIPQWHFLPTSQEHSTGDTRGSMTPGLFSIHALLINIHNSWAQKLLLSNSKLKELNDMDLVRGDEAIYQETRHILGAVMQKITYSDYLPLALGEARVESLNMQSPENDGYRNDYNKSLDATLSNEFGIAFRFPHPTISNVVESKTFYMDLAREIFTDEDRFKNPEFYSSSILSKQPSNRAPFQDMAYPEVIRNRIFSREEDDFRFGEDLFATDIKRTHDHGIASYNAYRLKCNLEKIQNFTHLKEFVQEDFADILEEYYDSVDDIDFYVGALAENLLEDAQVGPTFACIIGATFNNLQKGDRWFYENVKNPKKFTKKQLESIHETHFSDLLCYSNVQDKVQPNAFLYPNENNTVIDCDLLHPGSIMKTIDDDGIWNVYKPQPNP